MLWAERNLDSLCNAFTPTDKTMPINGVTHWASRTLPMQHRSDSASSTLPIHLQLLILCFQIHARSLLLTKRSIGGVYETVGNTVIRDNSVVRQQQR